MLNSYFSKINFILFIALVFSIKNLSAQCNPLLTTIPGLSCEEAANSAIGDGSSNGFLCSLDGYCTSNLNAPPLPIPIPFCTANSVINNPIWFSFKADESGILNVDVTPDNCTGDIQWALYDQCGNYFDAIACQSNPTLPSDQSFNISSLIDPGNIYYMLIDGANGGQCNFEFHSSSGIANTPLGDLIDPTLSNNVAVCTGENKSYSFGGYQFASSYQWTFNGQEVGITGGPHIEFIIPPVEEGTALLCVTALSSCDPETKQICWDIEVNSAQTIDLDLYVCKGDSLVFQNIYYKAGQYQIEDQNPNDCIALIELSVLEYDVNTEDTIQVDVCPGTSNFEYNGINYAIGQVYEDVVFENDGRCEFGAKMLVSPINISGLSISSTLEEIPCSQPTLATLSLNGDIVAANELISQTYIWTKTGSGFMGSGRTLDVMMPGDYHLEVTSIFKNPKILIDVNTEFVCIHSFRYVIKDSQNIFSTPIIQIESSSPQNGDYILSALPLISFGTYIWSVPDNVESEQLPGGKIKLHFDEIGEYSICVYVADFCSVSDEACFYLNIGELSKTKQTSFDDMITIRQNPVSSELIFETKSIVANQFNLNIYDINGERKLIESYTNIGSDISANVEQLSPGMYIYQINSGQDMIKTGKFIKI